MSTNQISVHSRLVAWYSFTAVLLLTIVVALLYWAMTSEAALHLPWTSFVSHERRVFFAIFVAGALVALLLAFFVTGHGLLGLDQLTRTVQDISTTSLDVRLDSRAMPKELRGLAEAFNQMLARMENSFSRLKQFSDDMAHELRTPLTRLQLQTEVMLSEKLDETEWREVLASNLEVLQQMSAMIDSMLFLARADSSQMTLDMEVFPVMEEAGKIIEYYEAFAEEKGIALKREGTAELRANRQMFGRLINNLVANAMRYTPAGGAISLVATTADTGEVSVSVRDNGCGMDAKHLPKLFNRFYRVDVSRSAAKPGTGLGLAIVKSIMDLHGGRVSIESEPGKGTEVRLIFPARK